MKDLVIMKNKQAVTTSLEVAKAFGKNHRDVIRTIENKISSAQNYAQYKMMFEESTYQDASGKSNKMYFMNRDGFVFIAMGFTGSKADEFKLKYIDAFNKMEQVIREQTLPQTPEEKLALTMEATIHLDKRVSKIEKTVADIKEKAEVDEGQRYQLLQARKSKVISACGGTDSNYYIEKKAKKVFSEFGRDFKKEFKIPRYDCLKSKKFDKAMEFTKNWYPSFVLQREIQNANAQTKLNLL